MATIRAYGKSIVVIPEQISDKTESGLLFLPESVKKERACGRVISVGGLVDLNIVNDDLVYYEAGEGLHIQVDGQAVLILRKIDILAKA